VIGDSDLDGQREGFAPIRASVCTCRSAGNLLIGVLPFKIIGWQFVEATKGWFEHIRVEKTCCGYIDLALLRTADNSAGRVAQGQGFAMRVGEKVAARVFPGRIPYDDSARLRGLRRINRQSCLKGQPAPTVPTPPPNEASSLVAFCKRPSQARLKGMSFIISVPYRSCRTPGAGVCRRPSRDPQ